MPWFSRKNPKLAEQPTDAERKVQTEGVFVKCLECDTPLYKGELESSQQVCKNCGYHFRIDAPTRLKNLFDDGEYEKLDEDVTSTDPLEFVDSKPYKDRIVLAKEASGLPEAIVSGQGQVGGHLVYAGAMDMSFIGG